MTPRLVRKSRTLKPGVNPDAYASALQNTLGSSCNVNAFSGGAKALLAVVTLVAMLTLLIIAVAGLGVLNTVALQIRERATTSASSRPSA